MNHLGVANGELIPNRKSPEFIADNVLDNSRAISPTCQLDDSKELIGCSSVTNLQLPATTWQQPMMNFPAVVDIDDIHLADLQVSSPVKSPKLLSFDHMKSKNSWSSTPSSLICHTDTQSVLEVKYLFEYWNVFSFFIK